jgi:hypothetical protein
VLGRRVHRDQPERLVTGVDEVVPGPGPNEDEVVGADLGRLAVELRLATPVDEDEHLVRLGMDLLPDLAAHRDGHHHDLLVHPGEHLTSEGLVRPRGPRDVDPNLLCCHLVLHSRSSLLLPFPAVIGFTVPRRAGGRRSRGSTRARSW